MKEETDELTFIHLSLACKWREGKQKGSGKREPVGMAKDFDFQNVDNLCYVKINLSLCKHKNNN